MSPLVSDRMAQCPINSSLVLGLWFPLPLGGEGTQRHQKKKKKGVMLVHNRIFAASPFLSPDACIKESTRCSPLSHTYYVACRCPCGSLHPKNKKKKGGLHTRAAIATPPHCQQWSNQKILSCGALPAVRDGLKTAVSVFGRFFA